MKTLKNILILSFIVLLGSNILFVGRANAIFGAGDTVVVVADTSFTSIQRTIDTTMNRVKNYVLDGLAWTVAKMTLQHITASVVDWINNGFEGNPSFLTNPEAFFLDVGDQITGDFISKTGILSGLCTPFNIDLRLSLALGQSGRYRERYWCTLNTVINSVKNSTVNGASIEGFMNGDFRQGGWPAYIALTTEPQNNYIGAYITAQSDLLQRIGVTQDRYKQDMIQGRGFLSFEKCKDLSVPELADQRYFDETEMGADYSAMNDFGSQTVDRGENYYSGASMSVKKIRDPKTGNVTYKNCSIETPGSVIAGSVDKALGIPQDTLNLADSINEIVGALFSQLVSKVLTGGLHSAGKSGTGYSGGIASQIHELTVESQIAPMRTKLAETVQTYYSDTSTYVGLRQQAVDSINNVKRAYVNARECFNAKVGSSTDAVYLTPVQISYARGQMAAIDSIIVTRIAPLEARYGTKLNEASAKMTTIRRLLTEIDNATSSEAIQYLSAKVSAAISSSTQTIAGNEYVAAMANPMDIQNAQNDIDALNSELQSLLQEVPRYERSCTAFPYSFY